MIYSLLWCGATFEGFCGSPLENFLPRSWLEENEVASRLRNKAGQRIPTRKSNPLERAEKHHFVVMSNFKTLKMNVWPRCQRNC